MTGRLFSSAGASPSEGELCVPPGPRGRITMSSHKLVLLFVSTVLIVSPALALPGEEIVTPVVPPELPVEVETELGPAGSLKQPFPSIAPSTLGPVRSRWVTSWVT